MSSYSIAVFNQDITEAFLELQKPEWKMDVNPRRRALNSDGLLLTKPHGSLLIVPTSADLRSVCGDLARRLNNAVWMEVLFLEKVVWHYRLYEGDELVEQFMVDPEIWECEAKVVDPARLARLWKVKEKDINRYLVLWTEANRCKKAYFWDSCRFGQFEQGYDFIYRLTGLSVPEYE